METTAPSRSVDAGPPGSSEQRSVYLLSLFDGVGTAMVALDTFFRTYHPGLLAGGWFAEIRDELALPTAHHWAASHAAGGPFFEHA
eukprot:2078590-Heterocapsa_arctica.AAC.1